MKCFNTTAVCVPSRHYMVDISKRVAQIKSLVDDGKYFTINRARQYGKTTTLNELRKELVKQYDVVFLDFGQHEVTLVVIAIRQENFISVLQLLQYHQEELVKKLLKDHLKLLILVILVVNII